MSGKEKTLDEKAAAVKECEQLIEMMLYDLHKKSGLYIVGIDCNMIDISTNEEGKKQLIGGFKIRFEV